MSTKKKHNNKRDRERETYKDDDTMEEDEDFELLDIEAKRIRSSNSHAKLKDFDPREIVHGGRDRKKLFTSNPHFSAHERSKIQDENLKECYDELCLLMDLPMSAPFLEPVNYVKLNIWDYAEIIKHPMDLGTIKKLLVRGVIENPDHFYLYVQLVFDNAKLYNKFDSTIHQNSIKLWSQFCEKFNSIFIPEDLEENIMIASDENIDELYEKAKAVRAEIARTRDSRDEVRGVMRREQTRRIRFLLPKMELTYLQKEEMCKQISELPFDDLPGLLEIIKLADKNSTDADPSGEVEIDIEKLDTQSLIQIRRYIYEKNNARNAKRNQKPAAIKQNPSSQSQKNLTINNNLLHNPLANTPSSPTAFNAALYTGVASSYPGYYAAGNVASAYPGYYPYANQSTTSTSTSTTSSTQQFDPTVNSVTSTSLDTSSTQATVSSFNEPILTENNNEEITMTDMTLIDSILVGDNTTNNNTTNNNNNNNNNKNDAAVATNNNVAAENPTNVDNNTNTNNNEATTTPIVSNPAAVSDKVVPYVGMTLPLCPDENSTEGFWLGAITAIYNTDSITVQWFELKSTDSQGRRLYEKSFNTDLVPLASAYHQIDLTTKLIFDSATNYWILENPTEALEKVRLADEQEQQLAL
jgi:hypothetical protein